jgi:hypothetical protein
MPNWFSSLNTDFRYQLTVIDEGDTNEFVQAKVVRKMSGVGGAALKEGESSEFVVRTSRPGVEVSWQVTGVRQDAWARAHRVPVEEVKTGIEAGRYIHPELFGQPASMSIEAGKSAVEALK